MLAISKKRKNPTPQYETFNNFTLLNCFLFGISNQINTQKNDLFSFNFQINLYFILTGYMYMFQNYTEIKKEVQIES